MALTPQDFVSKWKRVAAREKQSIQRLFLDLCQFMGHPTQIEDDPSDMRFAFEMDAQGWVQPAKIDYFCWEYKGKDTHEQNLTKADEQLLRYRDALKNPPLLIASEFILRSILNETSQ